MKLYRFLTGPDDATFCHKVTAALNKGWHLFGSPTYAFDKKTKTMSNGSPAKQTTKPAEAAKPGGKQVRKRPAPV